MKSKLFIVLAVFASVGKSSFANISSFYDLSEEQSAVFSEFRDNQKSTNANRFASWDPTFQLLVEIAAKLTDGQEIKYHNNIARIAASDYNALRAISAASKSYSTGTGKSCNNILFPIRYAWYFNKIQVEIGEAIKLAESGYNTSENEAALEEHRLKAQDDNKNMIGMIYDFLRNCEDTTDAQTLAMFASSEEISLRNSLSVVDAAFNAAKSTLIANSAERKNVALLSSVETEWRNARDALMGIATSEHALSQAFYLQKQRKLSGLATQLFQIQYTWLAMSDSYISTAKTTCNAIRRYSNGTDSVELTTIKNIASTYCKKAFRYFIESVTGLNPAAKTAAQSAWEYGVTFSNEAIGGFYDAIAMTQGDLTSCEIKKRIRKLKAAGLDEIPVFVDTILELIRNEKTWDDEVEAKIENIRGSMNESLARYFVNIYNAIQGLANRNSDAIETSCTAAPSEIDIFSYEISNLRYVTLVAKNSIK